MTFKKTHGQSLTPEYFVWKTIRDRCNNPMSKKYPYYGGRGIKLCGRWNSYENFIADMGSRPLGMTIERVNNDGDYEPLNCRWATQAEQNRNRGKYTYSSEDDANLREAIGRGCNFRQTAEIIGRSRSSVSMRAHRLGLKSGQPARRSTP